MPQKNSEAKEYPKKDPKKDPKEYPREDHPKEYPREDPVIRIRSVEVIVNVIMGSIVIP